MVGLGSIINALSIIVGGLIGIILRRFLKQQHQEALSIACGLSVLFIAIQGAMEKMLVSDHTLLIVLSLAIGTFIGELIDIESLIERLGEWIKRITKSDQDAHFVNGFVMASLTVCIGAMAIVGAIEDGLTGNYSLLLVKSILDFVIVAVMASSMGLGCLFSAFPVLIFEGLITLLAKVLSPLMSTIIVNSISLVGSILIFGVGVNLIWGKKIRVANMLPSILVAIFLTLVL